MPCGTSIATCRDIEIAPALNLPLYRQSGTGVETADVRVDHIRIVSGVLVGFQIQTRLCSMFCDMGIPCFRRFRDWEGRLR